MNFPLNRISAPGSENYVNQTHHSLIWIINVVGDVQQLRVLQLFTESLQQRHRLIESDRHGDSGQVFADVVVQDGHDANVAVVCSWGGEGSATAWRQHRSVQLKLCQQLVVLHLISWHSLCQFQYFNHFQRA